MSYQTIDLVYGVTMTKNEYENTIKPMLKKVKKELGNDLEDIVVYKGYYYSTYKVGISIKTDEVRMMQNFVFDFSIPETKELENILKEHSELFSKIGLKPEDFTLGVCTYNY